MTFGTRTLLLAALAGLAAPAFANSHTEADRKANAMASSKMAAGDKMATDKMATGDKMAGDKMAAGDKMTSSKAMPAKKKITKSAKPTDKMAAPK